VFVTNQPAWPCVIRHPLPAGAQKVFDAQFREQFHVYAYYYRSRTLTDSFECLPRRDGRWRTFRRIPNWLARRNTGSDGLLFQGPCHNVSLSSTVLGPSNADIWDSAMDLATRSTSAQVPCFGADKSLSSAAEMGTCPYVFRTRLSAWCLTSRYMCPGSDVVDHHRLANSGKGVIHGVMLVS
jgi:hypothetical protein